MQSRKWSLIESICNLFIGYIISVLLQVYMFPLFGVYLSVNDNMLIVFIFTMFSLVRNYIFRLVFNSMRIKNLQPTPIYKANTRFNIPTDRAVIVKFKDKYGNVLWVESTFKDPSKSIPLSECGNCSIITWIEIPTWPE